MPVEYNGWSNSILTTPSWKFLLTMVWLVIHKLLERRFGRRGSVSSNKKKRRELKRRELKTGGSPIPSTVSAKNRHLPSLIK
jgi:hypothetical protein